VTEKEATEITKGFEVENVAQVNFSPVTPADKR
jgi:hypothetical protein